MPRIWFNRTYATSVHTLRMLRENPEGEPVTLIGTHADLTSPVLQECDLALEEPHSAGDEYAEWAVDFATRNGVDVFVPRLNQLDIARHADAFAAAGIGLVCPPASCVEVFMDKGRSHEAVAESGLRVAPWRVARTAEELDAALDELHQVIDPGIPLCIKPVDGVGGAGFRIIADDPFTLADLLAYPTPENSRSEILQALRAAEAEGVDYPALIVQPVLGAPEISVDVLGAPGGRLLAAVPRIKDGRVRTLADDHDAVEYARTIVEHFELSFLGNVQLRFWQGERVLLEVNTRAAGGLYQTSLAGVNMMWAAIKLAWAGEAEPLPVKLGARYQVLDFLRPLPAS